MTKPRTLLALALAAVVSLAFSASSARAAEPLSPSCKVVATFATDYGDLTFFDVDYGNVEADYDDPHFFDCEIKAALSTGYEGSYTDTSSYAYGSDEPIDVYSVGFTRLNGSRVGNISWTFRQDLAVGQTDDAAVAGTEVNGTWSSSRFSITRTS